MGRSVILPKHKNVFISGAMLRQVAVENRSVKFGFDRAKLLSNLD
jgi:hypothetical protein